MPEDTKVILSKLDDQAGLINGYGDRLGRIENALATLAVQEEKIYSLRKDTTALWTKYDNAFQPNGVVSQVVAFQSSCPRAEMDRNLANQWKSIGRQWMFIKFLYLVVTGLLGKALGLF